MKILLIHTHYNLHGGEDAVVTQEVELLQQHHEVSVLYFQNLSGWQGAIQFLSSIWNKRAADQVKSRIKEFRPDVVHIHNWHFAIGPLVFRAIHDLNVPIVHTVHNYRLLCPSGILLCKGKLFTDSLQQSFPWSAVWNKVYRESRLLTLWLAFVVWFHKKMGTWNKIGLYVCLTSFAIYQFQKSTFGVPEKQFMVKPNFRSQNVLDINIKSELHFLFIGRLSEEKGIEVLLDAFKGLPFSIKIAGEGPMIKLVNDSARLFSNISYMGSLSSEEVIQELQQSAALLLPSVCYEGMPMTIIEAFSVGTPVIASKLGAMSSMILHEQNGLHFEPGNVKDLQDAVIKFCMFSDAEKKKMGTNAFLSYCQKYAPDLQRDYFDAIYNKVVIK